MDKQLEKIIKIVKNTGDRIVVISDDTEFLITSLDDYSRILEGGERLAGLTESEMLGKINRDIAFWRSSQVEQNEENVDANLKNDLQTPSYQSLDAETTQEKIDDLTENIDQIENIEVVNSFEDSENGWQEDTPEIDTEKIKSELKNEDIDWDDSFDFEEDSDESSDQDIFSFARNRDTEDIDSGEQKPDFISNLGQKPKNPFKKDDQEASDNEDSTQNSYNIPPPPDINK
jgi:hypothetical protein